jgi:superfamily II DNA or RNA helicase
MSTRSKFSRKSKGNRVKSPKLSRTSKPVEMTLEQWQIELRKQFGRTQAFRIKNLGDHTVYSEFQVTNPESKSSYRVRIRGRCVGDNACTCPDFATNTLGTCKHIECVLARLERGRETSVLLRQGFLPEFSEIYLQYGARREIRFRPGSECTPEMSRLAANFFDDEGVLRADALAEFNRFLEKAGEYDPDLRVGVDVLAYLAEVRDAVERQRRVAEAFPRGPRSAAFKDLLKVPLYEYQREGALFAAKAGRCLIADEMGLGKTIQAIAAAEMMAMRLGVERVLVICPTSLKHQWKREIEKFTDRSVEVVNGLRTRRQECFAAPGNFFKITNYDTVYADLDLIEAWKPDLVILDEAQRIKNWSTRVARSVKKINSAYAIVLTGTPLENRLEELVSIVQFVDRYRLGPTFRLLNEHQKVDEVGKVVGYQNLDRIGQTLEPVLIRRQKDHVLSQLPERIDSNIFVPMTEEQRKHHRENQELVASIVQKWRRHKFLTESDRRKLMAGLQNMRMSCDSSYLLDTSSDHGVKSTEAVTLLGEILERPGAKVVIFSQWLRMHELLTQRLKKKGWEHVLFHGGVPSSKRKNLIDRFRDDPKCRLFLSTDAGGVGLNLQFASVVMNMDLPWNPAVLEQRIGRVHRLGQEQPVRVVNFIAQGTIEEGMLGVLSFKKSLFAGVLDDGAPNIDFGGSRLKKFMETVESVTERIPEPPASSEADGAVNEFSGGRSGSKRQRDEDAIEERPAPADPWSGLLQTGMAFLQRLAAPPSGQAPANSAPVVQRDEKTGESFLRLPIPDAKIVNEALSAIGKLLEGLRR